MDIRGTLILAGDAARAMTQIGLDWVDRATGEALPTLPEQLATTAAVNGLLRDHPPTRGTGLPLVSDVALAGVDFESSNCQNFLIDVEFDELTRESQGALPRTMYVKLPCEELTTRVFGNAIGFWPLECWFCDQIAARVPIRVPSVYAVAQRGARFALLLENLSEDPSVRLFINRDMAAGTDLIRARRCLTAFAELHSAFSGLGVAEQEALLPRAMHTYLSPRRRRATRALNSVAIKPAHRAAPSVFNPSLVRTCEEAIVRWDAMVEHWYSGPLTLVHGDSHLGNCFEYKERGEDRVGLLDFQAVHWSKGIRDVQYFLINSLDSKLLAENEDELIEFYVSESARFGNPIDLNESRQHYRAFVFQTLMTAVVPLGLGSLTERNETVLTILERSCAAAERLDLDSWIRSV